MENYWNIPANTTCVNHFNSQYGLIGFALSYVVSRCLLFRKGDTMGGQGGRGVDQFLTYTANEYFANSPQIILLYDESWDITEMIIKLELSSEKAFIKYFLPINPKIEARIKTKGWDDESHKYLPKATAFIVFVGNAHGFRQILERVSKYPWWNKRARLLILVKEKSLEPTKTILTMLEKGKIFNGVVVTEVTSRDGRTGGGLGIPVEFEAGFEDDQDVNSAALQIAALEPYPGPGQAKHAFVARWSGSSFTARLRPIFQEKIDNLRGHKLRAIVFEFPPLVMWAEISPKKFGYTGLEVKIFDELSSYINFTYEIYELKGTERWGTDLGDGDWTGLIGEVSKSKADIGFANIFLLDGREKVVDITSPYDQDRGCFAVPRPEALQHWLGLVLPFSWEVWACLLSMAAVAGPIFSFITRPLKFDVSMSVGRGIYYALGAMVSVQKAPKAKSHALRSFVVAWLVFCWLACIMYRVALIVSLTVGPRDFQIDTIKQLVRSGLRWGGFPEVLRAFDNTTDRSDRKLVKRFQPVDDIFRALDRIANKADFAVMDSGKLLQYAAKGLYFNGYSSAIHVTRECPTSYNVGFALPIGSPFYDRINYLISLMQSAGLIHYWLEEIQYLAMLRNPNKRKGKKGPGLTVGHLKLILIICTCCYFVAFLSFCVEYFLAWRRRRKFNVEKTRKKDERKKKRRVKELKRQETIKQLQEEQEKQRKEKEIHQNIETNGDGITNRHARKESRITLSSFTSTITSATSATDVSTAPSLTVSEASEDSDKEDLKQ